MADQDFNIKVVTTADTTGIRQTSRELEQLKNQQATFAETARRQAAATTAAATAKAPAAEATGGITGTAIGIGTIVTLLTGAINKWRQFEDEQDKIIEQMTRAREKTYELGLSVVDMLDKAKDIERIDTEPLEQSFDRLTGDVRRLKTEMQIAFESGAYEDVKKLNGELGFTKGLLDRVNAGLERQAAASEKARQKQVQAQEDAYGSASPQAKAILENEKRARETGDQAFQKTADQFRKSATPADLAAVQSVTDAYGKPTRPGREAGVGESQDLVDGMERNRIAAEKQNKLTDQAQDQQQEPPTAPLTNPPPKEDMIAKPIDEKTIGAQGADIIKAIVHLESALLGLWR